MKTNLPLRVALVAMGLVLFTGCIRSTRVEIRQSGTSQEVDLARRWHGVTLGPCGFVTGAHANYSIHLTGPGPVYPVGQIQVLTPWGKVDEYVMKGLTGEVRVDSTRRVVRIALQRGKHPLEFNGRYKYRER